MCGWFGRCRMKSNEETMVRAVIQCVHVSVCWWWMLVYGWKAAGIATVCGPSASRCCQLCVPVRVHVCMWIMEQPSWRATAAAVHRYVLEAETGAVETRRGTMAWMAHVCSLLATYSIEWFRLPWRHAESSDPIHLSSRPVFIVFSRAQSPVYALSIKYWLTCSISTPATTIKYYSQAQSTILKHQLTPKMFKNSFENHLNIFSRVLAQIEKLQSTIFQVPITFRNFY